MFIRCHKSTQDTPGVDSWQSYYLYHQAGKAGLNPAEGYWCAGNHYESQHEKSHNWGYDT
eukprot:13733167-Ditylum_brightwellii.AAC.1